MLHQTKRVGSEFACFEARYSTTVRERLALGFSPRQPPHGHDDLALHGEGAVPVIGFRLGRQDRVSDRLLVVASPQPHGIVGHH
jgi:hypothetical protein